MYLFYITDCFYTTSNKVIYFCCFFHIFFCNKALSGNILYLLLLFHYFIVNYYTLSYYPQQNQRIISAWVAEVAKYIRFVYCFKFVMFNSVPLFHAIMLFIIVTRHTTIDSCFVNFIFVYPFYTLFHLYSRFDISKLF